MLKENRVEGMRNGNTWEVERDDKGQNDKKKNQTKTGISMSDILVLTKTAYFEFLWIIHLLENEMI